MPREIVHWLVLRESITKLRNSGRKELAILLSQVENMARLGAIAHDAPYFYRFSRDVLVPRIAERLHGRDGEDTFAPILRMLLQAQKEATDIRPALKGFFYGMLSHCVTDWTFHPLIFYLTGNYYHPDLNERLKAQRRHRVFEVYLDSYFETAYSHTAPCTLQDIIEAAPTRTLNCAYRLLTDESFELAKLSERENVWARCFREFSLSQKILRSASGGTLIRTINFLCGGRLGGIDGLCRVGRTHSHPIFSENLTYRNPVSGIETSASVDSLFHAAVDEFVDVLQRLENQETNFAPGKSLAYGLPHVKVEEGKYFSAGDFPFT